ncbi:MAG: hypothetical protein IJ064_05515 [Bacteroidaceae bacterium]|nr:hypothetical protein [Bacteroidaceae bacterium]
MGKLANLVNDPETILAANDSVVIRQYNGGITGGRTNDLDGFDGPVKGGHLVVRTKDEDGVNYTYKPMPVDGDKYADLPANHEYVGVTVATKSTDYPLFGIMDDGRVNDVAMPYQFKDEAQRAAVKAALPNLIFEHD